MGQSPSLGKLYAAPGNPGIASHAELVELDPADHGAVIGFCREAAIGLVVVGPEAPLVAGLADDLRAAGIAVFGPGRAAARLEGSKGFTKALCAAAGIPTAGFARAETAAEGLAKLDPFGLPVVVKADGLAAGKGVVIATSRAEAEAAIRALDGPMVIEEYLHGEEASLFALADGERVVAFGSAQDHKRVGDGDTGPNTGGMGAYSPARVLTPALERQALEEIVQPTVDALARAGTPFVGILYAGLMLTDHGPKLIEYNVRLGDPEAQVLLPRFEGDLVALFHACAIGRLDTVPPPRFADRVALTVVMAARGYPGPAAAGGEIAGLDAAAAAGAIVFQAGTRREGDALVAAGGRVLAVTAEGPSVRWAQSAAYLAVDRIDFPSGFCRRDIGWREVARETV